jgi:outer membrane protein insertion porin family
MCITHHAVRRTGRSACCAVFRRAVRIRRPLTGAPKGSASSVRSFGVIRVFLLLLALVPAVDARAQQPSKNTAPGELADPPEGNKDRFADPEEERGPGWVPENVPDAPPPAPKREAPKAVPGVKLPDFILASVDVEGNLRTERDAILQNIRVQPGQRFDQRAIREDVRRLHSMGLFKDIRVAKLNGPNGGIVLVFVVTEKPTIHEVLVEGNDEVSTDDVKGAIDLKPLQIVDSLRLNETVKKVQKLYTDKGYYLAEVKGELRAPKDKKGEVKTAGEGRLVRGEEMDVVVVVVENAKVVIERISFMGNNAVPDDDIRQFLQTRENHPLGRITDWGTYKEEDFQIDLLRVEALYQDRGYLNVKVGQPRVRLTSDRKHLHVTIPIEEGDQYHLRTVKVDGDLLDPDSIEPYGEWVDRLYTRGRRAIRQDRRPLEKKLLDFADIRPGDVFSRSQVAKDIQSLSDLYKDAGYCYVQVAPDTTVDGVGRTVDLSLAVQKGPLCTIERIEIVGNEKTRDRVIRREMRVYEGELYSQSGLRESEARLGGMGFFEKVDITQRQGSAPDMVEVIVEVKEKSTGTFQLGAGFSSAENFLLQGQIAQNNFLGRGQTLSASASLSSLRRFFDFNLVEPYLYVPGYGDTRFTGSISLFNTLRVQPGFSRTGTGGDISVGYPIYRYLRIFVGLMGERTEIDAGSFSVTLAGLKERRPRWNMGVRGTLAYDTRNDRLFPSKGFFHTLTMEGVSRYPVAWTFPVAEGVVANQVERYRLPEQVSILRRAGDVNDFVRMGLALRGYYPIGYGFTVRGQFRAGYLANTCPSRITGAVGAPRAYGSDTCTPLYTENYYAGGFGSVRGYSPRSIGPVQRVAGLSPDGELTEFVVGGNKEILFNLELEIPIVEKLGIRAVVFMDAGNVYAANENFFYVLTDRDPALRGTPWDPRDRLRYWGGMYWSVGAGFRWQSPIGPLRFEWGVPLTRRPRGTVGYARGDDPVLFEFNIGQSF